MYLYKIIIFTVLFAGVLPFLLMVIKKRVFNWKNPIVPFVWLTAIAVLYEFFGSYILEININYWFQIYSLSELIAVYYFFYRLLGFSFPKYYLVFSFLLIIGYIISLAYWNPNNTFISLAINKSVLTAFVFGAVFLWFRQIYVIGDIPDLLRHDNFYFVSGFFMYYSVTFCVFLLGRFIFDSEPNSYEFWLANVLATFILRILLLIGVWKMKPLSKYFSGLPQ